MATFNGTSGNDALTGASTNDILTGLAGDDNLTGLAGNDTLDGGLGNDTMNGGAGSDIYTVDSASDVVIEISSLATEIDTVNASVSYTLGINVEKLTLTGITALNGTGNNLNNTLTGNSAANVLDGKTGADTLTGGTGNDTYVVDNVGDIVVETSALATELDLVQSSIAYTLTANVENLTLTGTTAVIGSGNSLANNITGNAIANNLNGGAGIDTIDGGAGNDTIDGGLGNDSMIGGAGDDVYLVDNALDIVTEAAGGGTDLVKSAISYTLTAEVENLEITGAGVANATGNSLNNILTGNYAANILDGGIGNDTMIGGLGNDTYVVNVIGDVVQEASTLATEIDSVQSAVSYTLGANLEKLTLTGTASTATGNTLNNTLTGNAGNNTLDGGLGNDTMIGGLGNDIYVVNVIGDVVQETSTLTTESDTVQSVISYTLNTNVEKLILTGVAAINGAGNTLNNDITGNSAANSLVGGTGNDTITGDAGNDTLDGGAGNDSLVGGLGDDTYLVDSVTDSVVEAGASGNDLVKSIISYTLSLNVENVELYGSSSVNATGNISNNLLTGNLGSNILDGGTGNDTMVGSLGNDIYVVDALGDVVQETSTVAAEVDTVLSAITYTIGANVEKLTLTGVANNSAYGNALSNTLTGNAGNNTFDGGVGNDTMIGGLGNDIYIVNIAGDVVQETSTLAGEIDEIQASVSYTLATNVEKLTLTSAAVAGTGNGTANTILGNSAANTLFGSSGNDTLTGLVGNDTIDGGADNDSIDGGIDNDSLLGGTGNDVINGGDGIDFVDGGDGNDSLDGGIGNDVLKGGLGNDTLNGGDGNDSMDGGVGNDSYAGGAGDDFYLVENAADTISEGIAGGTDSVQSAIGYTLSANVENLEITGSSVVNGTGNASNNILIGNNAANILDGGAGNDTMTGGLGNDTYVIDVVTDVIQETSTVATELDLVQSAISYTLGVNLEKLTLTGVANNSAFGNALSNTLTGNAGNNTLDGGLGNDNMAGGLGNDTYFVESISDYVTETSTLVGETDLVSSSVSFILGANVENLTLTGAAAINGTGNSSANTLTGNSGNNILSGGVGNDAIIGNDGNDSLDGGAGNDIMTGGLGNDTYVVDSLTDSVVETSALVTEIDTVKSVISYTLNGNVENLTLSGLNGISGTGNSFNNYMSGNSADNTMDGGIGNDTLDGFGGNDVLIGGLGNDTYYVDSTNDSILETSAITTEIDVVYASIDYYLAGNVENISLIGTANIGATGNYLNNVMIGNGAANYFQSEAGNDTITGGLGNDKFFFVAPTGYGNDTITDFTVGADKIVIAGANFATDLISTGLTAAQFVTGTAATTADQRFIYNSTTGALLFDYDGNLSGAASQIATLSTNPALGITDFIIQ
jgi:serralysin